MIHGCKCDLYRTSFNTEKREVYNFVILYVVRGVPGTNFILLRNAVTASIYALTVILYITSIM